MERTPVVGLRITADGGLSENKLKELEDYQQAVGGLIEPVTLKDGGTMYVNEEFLYNGSGPNWFASDVAGVGGCPQFLLNPIRGDVVLVGPVDDEGYDTDVQDSTRAMAAGSHRTLRSAPQLRGRYRVSPPGLCS
jgi:hypothetical protein